MINRVFLILIFLGLSTWLSLAQSFISTSDLFTRTENKSGTLNLNQDQAIDTLINRYIYINQKVKDESGFYGMDGYRIQIYSSSNRNARKESDEANADFIEKFPDIISYPIYAKPGYFKIRAGDFRTKTEATKIFLMVSKEFPDAYLVPDIIHFPDLNTK
jgi:hypothetical protein